MRIRLLLALALILVSGLALAQADPACPGRTVDHLLGSSCVPESPQRVVVLEYSFADALAQLGLPPVGLAQEATYPTYLAPYVDAATPVGSRAEPSLEAILALEPDLIIADFTRHEQYYDSLTLIAPTLVLNSYRGSYEDQLDDFMTIATALGRTDLARELLDEHRRLFAGAKRATDASASPVVVGVLSPGRFTAHSSESFIGSLLERLGRRDAVRPRGGEIQFPLSLEGLAALEPSALVLMCNPGEATPLDQWRGSAVWQSFEAVKSNRVYVFNRDLWSKGRGLLAFNEILAQAQDSGLLADTPAGEPPSCG